MISAIKIELNILLHSPPFFFFEKGDHFSGMLLHPPATAAFMLIIVAVILPVNCLPASVLQLHRAFPPNERVELDVLRARDAARHARILQSSGGGGVGGVVDFVVQGTSDPFLVG